MVNDENDCVKYYDPFQDYDGKKPGAATKHHKSRRHRKPKPHDQTSKTYVGPPPDGSIIYDMEFEVSPVIDEVHGEFTSTHTDASQRTLFTDSYGAGIKKSNKITADQ